MGLGLGIKRQPKMSSRERRDSIDSTSTITEDGRHGTFGTIDDNVSVGDSNFQGDDEDSVASSYVEDASLREAKTTSLIRITNGKEERYSMATLSQRAEKILANAKQRLTVRSGFHVSVYGG